MIQMIRQMKMKIELELFHLGGVELEVFHRSWKLSKGSARVTVNFANGKGAETLQACPGLASGLTRSD